MKTISGFSKLTKEEKIKWLSTQVNPVDQDDFLSLSQFWCTDTKLQKMIDEFSENTISNFIFPYGVAPNVLINDKVYTLPLVIEESSVVAACAKSAKFWLTRGGFKTKVLSTTKKGQVHLSWNGSREKLLNFFSIVKSDLLANVKPHLKNMEKRGGGIKDILIVDKNSALDSYYQIDVSFETCDAMGANFINTVLEAIGSELLSLAMLDESMGEHDERLEVIMCILSNYTPDCVVNVSVECPINELGMFGEMGPTEFAKRFERAVNIAKVDVNRAVTHNKGIFNGIDALVIATGNDFRAIEACGHAYAARDGQYRGLSSCSLTDGVFKFEMTIPLALGTVGGLTKLHPMAKLSLALLGHPNATELMSIVATAGLAQNFGALRSLVTTGIQKGHMKMHLLNILNQLGASKIQVDSAKKYFKNNTVSFQSVREFLEQERNIQ